MKKVLLTVLAAATVFASTSQAEIKSPVWTCGLTFRAAGGGLQAVVGLYRIAGRGHISCVDVRGNTEVIPVKVTLSTRFIAPNLAAGYFAIAGASSGVGLATRPEALLGKYYALSANDAFIVGTGSHVSIHGGAEAVNLNLGLNLVAGFGTQFGINKVTIEALN